jgi:hypothetical protein
LIARNCGRAIYPIIQFTWQFLQEAIVALLFLDSPVASSETPPVKIAPVALPPLIPSLTTSLRVTTLP